MKKDKAKDRAVALLEDGKISAGKASELADMNYYEFEDYLKSKGIKWKD